MAKRRSKEGPDPAKAVWDEFYPKGRKRGIVVRIQADFSRSCKLLKYSLTLIDTRAGVGDNGRLLGYDNAHGYHHRHCLGVEKSVELESYEIIENRFEAEVRQYLEAGKIGQD